MIVVLDASPVSLLANPRPSPDTVSCRMWVRDLIAHGSRICLSEITDYEVRREAIRRSSGAGLRLLDDPQALVEYLPLTTAVMRRAAQLWADARNRGRPTADPAALDADVILAAQAQLLAEELSVPVVVATTSARHLTQFVDARGWRQITA